MKQAEGGHQIERLVLMRFKVSGVRDQELAANSEPRFSVFDLGARESHPNIVCIWQELEQITGTTANL